MSGKADRKLYFFISFLIFLVYIIIQYICNTNPNPMYSVRTSPTQTVYTFRKGSLIFSSVQLQQSVTQRLGGLSDISGDAE